MAVSKAKKHEQLAHLEASLKGAASVAFITTDKITVLDVESMKKDLRKVDAQYIVAKKTLIRIAMKNVFGAELDIDTLPGQVAVLIAKNDAVAGMGVVNTVAGKLALEFKASGKKLTFVGGYMEGKLLSAAEATQIAGLPSREVLLGRLLGSMKSPIAALARFFDAAGKDLTLKSVSKVGDLKGAMPVAAPAPAMAAPVETVTPEVTEEIAPTMDDAPAASAEEAPKAE